MHRPTRPFILATLAALLTVAACSRSGPKAQQYQLVGQVISVARDRSEVTVKHKDIPNFMPAMTMAYRVNDRTILTGIDAGDLITATLNVQDGNAWLSTIAKTGHAELAAGARPVTVMDVLQPGDAVPDDVLQDQDGAARKLSDWRGQAVAVTFIYTRCPLPNFCPLLDRNFAAVQRTVQSDAALRGRVHLLSVSFDPEHDTPAVLKAHANAKGADPRVWSYATAAPDVMEHFASRFGVSVIREQDPGQTITHNVRTAVIDPQGRVATIYGGYEWTPEQMVDALRHALKQ